MKQARWILLAFGMFALPAYADTAHPGPLHLASETTVPAIQSPRLQQLALALKQGDKSALEAFWSALEKESSPIIEALPDHPTDALYTFFWRADNERNAQNVRLHGTWPARPEDRLESFVRLGDSDVWYVSHVLPRAVRFIYGIAAPQGLQQTTSANGRFVMNGVAYEDFPDPLNARSLTQGEPPTQVTFSYVEGPAAPRSPHLEPSPEGPRGQIEMLDVASRIPGMSRKVAIYTPADRRSQLPFLLLFDGGAYRTAIPTPTILDNLIAQGLIPPIVAAFVEPPAGARRNDDVSPNDLFQKFLAEELMPLIRSKYGISSNPARNAIGGSSLGGLNAAYTALRHPEIFGNVISLSGSYWWSPEYGTEPARSYDNGNLGLDSGTVLTAWAEAPKRSTRVYLAVGSWESPAMRVTNRFMKSILKGKGCDVREVEFAGGHMPFNWAQVLPEALRWTFAGSAQ